MNTHNILVPSNFMINDNKSIDFVITNYGHAKDVQITLFHAYTPVPEIEMRNNPVMERMARNLSYQRQYLKDKEKELHKAKEKLIMGGFTSSQVNLIFTTLKNDISTDIIKLVREKHINTLVMTRTPNKIVRFFTKSVTKKISDTLGNDVELFILN